MRILEVCSHHGVNMQIYFMFCFEERHVSIVITVLPFVTSVLRAFNPCLSCGLSEGFEEAFFLLESVSQGR